MISYSRLLLQCSLAIIGFAHLTSAFYLPGVAPKDYKQNDLVPLTVNALTSPETAIPVDYYFQKFHFCIPKGGPTAQSESLGAILAGDRLFSSLFELKMLTNETCKQLCTVTIPGSDASFINEAIRDDYMFNWLIDGLPAAAQSSRNEPGFRLGSIKDKNSGPFLHNHYNIYVSYNAKEKANKFRVVGARVEPWSVKREKDKNSCDPKNPTTLNEKGENTVSYSYSVYWIESSTPWTTRWENYLVTGDERIHWFSVINSTCLVFLLSGIVGMILLRALRRDIARYNELEVHEEAQEEFGWKIVHGDVFRSPSYRMILSVLIGNGVQIGSMAIVTIVFASLGFLSPSTRGSLATMMLVFYVLFGCLSGYVSARYYKLFGGQAWRQNVVLSSVLVPSCIFGIFIFLNFFLIYVNSASAVPFTAMLALMAMWFFLSLPLALTGAYFGFKKQRLEVPVRTNQIPRQIPEQPWYLRSIPSILLSGILPFIAVFTELVFIMNSIWANRIYYVFGFLFLVFVMMVLTCSLVSIIACYFLLCSENYHWWWRSFLCSASAGLYMFLYGAVYFVTKLEIHDFAPAFIYFGWTLATSTLFGILTGTIGFLATFKFVKTIYASIKID